MMYGVDMPEWIDEEPEELRGLLRDLHWVRRRGIWGLRSGALPIPRLVEIAAMLFPRVSRQSQYELMKALFKTKLWPLLSEDDQLAIPEYFWLHGEPGMKSSTHRRRTVGQTIFTQGWSTFRRPDTGYERPFIIRIARAIDRLSKEALNHEESASSNNLTSCPYVRRDALHQEMKSLLDRGSKYIVLEGQVGTGKSRLAWEFAAEHADLNKIASLSLRHVNNSVIHAPFGILFKRGSLSASLEQVATGDNAPTFLILEDVDNEGNLLSVLPGQIDSTVIITTRRTLSMNRDRGSIVHVGPLEISEATQMAESRLQNGIHPDHARRLAQNLGRNALAIEQSCEILNQNRDLTLKEFGLALHNYAAQILAAVDDDARAPLPTIYYEIYKELTRVHPLAAELLENLAFAGAEGEHVESDFMEVCLRHSSQLADEYPVMGRVVFLNACRTLANWHMIDLSPGGIHISTLTQDILRDLLRESAETVCNRLLASIEPWETARREHPARVYNVAILQEMEAIHLSCEVSQYELWIKMMRNSLCPTPKYLRELDEIYDRHHRLLVALAKFNLFRLHPWLEENTVYSEDGRVGNVDFNKYLCYKK